MKTMKNRFLHSSGAAALTAVVLSAGMAFSTAQAASDSANATATVFTPISITNTSDLAFGTFTPGAGGTVVISTSGAASATGGVVLDGTSSTDFAGFNVGGNASDTYAITLPTSTTITDSSTGATMSVASFTSSPSGTSTLSGTGTGALQVGATLTVGANQAAGNYSGTFNVTVEYN